MTGSTGQRSDRDHLRKKARKKRDALEDREIKDRMIREAFFRLLISAEMKPERIFIYSSFGSEADTHGIMKALLDMGTEVFCPKVSENDMHFYRIFSEDDMKPGAFGIREPEKGEEGFPDRASDLVVVPGLLFDREGGRLGYGGGFYDRYLSLHPAETIALAYEAQIEKETLPKEPWDIPVCGILTETGFLKRTGLAYDEHYDPLCRED